MNQPAKPIEPGCLAMIIRSRGGNIGKIVSVIRKQDPPGTNKGGLPFAKGVWWLIDREVQHYDRLGKLSSREPYVREENIIRIDDPAFKSKQRTNGRKNMREIKFNPELLEE